MRWNSPSHISKIYYPIDSRRYVRRALRMVSPDAIVLVEAEIWPNFLWRAVFFAPRAASVPPFGMAV